MWAWVRTTTVSSHGDHGPGGGDPAPQDRLDVERPAAERQPFEQAEHLVEVGTGVDQAPECHVPGDAGEAVEPGDGATGTGAVAVDGLTAASGRRRTPRRSRCRCRPR